jgi:Fic family protein
LLKPLPLRDAAGRPFQYALPDPALELLHGLDKDAAGQILVTEQVASSEMRDRYVINSLMEEAITSSQIEGAATTRVVAKEMLRTGRKPRDRSEQMIFNNYAAMQRIRELKGQLTAETVFELHHIVTRSALDDPTAAGRFRRPDERVVVEDADGQVLHTPPPAGQLSSRMAAMCDFANGVTPGYFVHPVARAILLHFWLAHDHPFVDGNGRCARALFYWSMLRSGYWLSEFISISQVIRKAHSAYGRAFLYVETDENDATYFVLYHLDLIRRAIDELQQYLGRKMGEVREAERLLRGSDELNHRQIALLTHALRHPGGVYTIASHQASHNVVYETARTDLFELQRLGLLELRKRGRAYRFLPTRDLQERMKKL